MTALTDALAEIQANLPHIRKGDRADLGNYSYTYANLGDIHDAALPLVNKAGILWATRPNVEDGKFVLRYGMHLGDEELGGSYPLPSAGTAQQVGSAITYARRYCLCALLGIVPDDDDGQAASSQQFNQPAVVVTDDGWVADFIDRLNEAPTVGVLRGLWPELKLAVNDGRVAPADIPSLRALLEARAVDLEEAAAPTELIPEDVVRPRAKAGK